MANLRKVNNKCDTIKKSKKSSVELILKTEIKAKTYKIGRSILELSCGWRDCVAVYKTIWKLNDHITDHLNKMCNNADNKEIGCLWQECDFHTESHVEFQRHAYYHGYHTSLLIQGKLELENNNKIPKCALSSAGRNQLPDLKEDFKCYWAECKLTFKSIVEFQDHLLQHASFEYEIQRSPDLKNPKVQCNWQYCKKIFANKYRLIEHIQKHCNKKLAACYQCGGIFRTKTSFYDHCRRQVANNTHKYQCVHCFKFFATEKLLRYHVVKHVNCFKCSMCDMTCTSSSALATHIRYRHIKDRPLKCTECDYRCVRKSDLSSHNKYVHCKVVHHCQEQGCNYAVRTYNLLRRHYLEVHDDSPYIYVCHCCDKLFKNSKYLSRHLIKNHDIQLASGHKRFTYRIDENGFYRLETTRMESLEVAKYILSPNPLVSEITQESSCFQIRATTNNINPIRNCDERSLTMEDLSDSVPTGEFVITLAEIN